MNRDYYINKTDGKPIDFENVECELKFYHDYMSKVIKLLSPDRVESDIKADTAKILKFEQKLAEIMMTIEQARDFSNNYQDISIGELMNITTIPGQGCIVKCPIINRFTGHDFPTYHKTLIG